MAEKTHKPTSRRLQEARKKGDVVFSTEIASTLGYVLLLTALWLAGEGAFSALRELWLHATSAALFIRPAEHVPALMRHTTAVLMWGTAPVVVVAALGGLAGSFFQVGGMAAFQRLKPDMNRLSPAEGLKRVFSLRSLIDLLKMLAKTVLLGVLMLVVVRGFFTTALKLGHAHPSTTLAVAGRVLLMTFAWAAVIYAVMAAVDYVHKHYEFMKQMRMSIDDLRNEHKEQEGDPLNSSRRRSEHFQAVYASLSDRVKLSSAVIHSASVAVALQYRGPDDLPHVLARGQNEVAAQIRRLAGDALIPMAFDPSLAERLYAEVPQDTPIPRPFFAPVAKLLRWAQGQD